MPGKHVNLQNVIVGMAQVWTAPGGFTSTPTPGTPVTPMVADTVELDSDYPSPWTPIGATEQGVSFAVNPTVQDIDIEEIPVPALVTKTKEEVLVNFTMAEDTIDNMKLAYGGGTKTVTAPGVSTPGTSQLSLSYSLDQLAVGFDGINPFGFFRRVYIPSVLSVASVTTAYRRAAAERQYAVQLRAVCDPSLIIIRDKTAPHS